ncbi:MAG: hypothetical protein U0793_26105 [Gemmataceae bacterium]
MLYLKTRLGLTQQQLKPFLESLPKPVGWGGLRECADLVRLFRDMGASADIAPVIAQPTASVAIERILDVLTHDGLQVGDWFLVRVSGTDIFVPNIWDPRNGAMACAIEDEELAGACVAYLKKMGARRFQTWRHMMDTAQKEKWPQP